MRYLTYIIVSLSLLAPQALNAGVILHDVADSDYTSLAGLAAFAPVGDLLLGSGRCSGTLIQPGWVLTAAHCLDDGVDPLGVSFDLTDSGGGIHFGVQSFLAPTYTDFDASAFKGDDIALLKLGTMETTVAAASLNAGTSEVGNTGTYVGYGRTGDGLTGATLSSGTKRAGQNVMDATGSVFGFSSGLLFSDFDSPLGPISNNLGSSSPLDLEYQIAPGDSGGGMFMDFGSGMVLTGVISGIAAFDGTQNSDYGDLAFSTRVSSHHAWILDTIAANSINTVPEPSSLAIFGIGAFGLVLVRGNRKRS